MTVERHLGHTIAVRRRRLGLTQAQLAERSGVAVETISRLERGTAVPSLSRLGVIARSLGAEPRDLLDEPSDPTPEARSIDRVVGLLLARPVADVDLIGDLAARVLASLDEERRKRG